jgi:hypothetical protein
MKKGNGRKPLPFVFVFERKYRRIKYPFYGALIMMVDLWFGKMLT